MFRNNFDCFVLGTVFLTNFSETRIVKAKANHKNNHSSFPSRDDYCFFFFVYLLYSLSFVLFSLLTFSKNQKKKNKKLIVTKVFNLFRSSNFASLIILFELRPLHFYGIDKIVVFYLPDGVD